MSASKFTDLLHNGFGIKNVIIKTARLIDKIFVFEVTMKSSLKKCSKCHSRNVRLKDSKTRKFKMVPLGNLSCWLHVKVLKFYCRDCGCSAWCKLPFAAGKLPMTIAFVNYTLSLVKFGTIQAVAGFLGLHWKTIKNIHKEHLEKKYKKIKYRNLVYLSMDEFSIKRGHKYITVFLDLRSGRIIFACEGRSIEKIEPFLRTLKKRARSLKAIAMDLSPTYISAVKNILPHVAIVFDKFHVVKLLNDMMDGLRRSEHMKMLQEGIDIGKGDRFLFLKNLENLDVNQKEKLDKLLAINQVLSTAYIMKEQFRDFWNKASKQAAAKFLMDWILSAHLSEIPALQRMADTLLRHSDGLLAYYDHPISNAKIEGTNNKIKCKKRQGYGYTDIDYFTLLLYDLHNSKAA